MVHCRGLETEFDRSSPAVITKEKLICLGKFPKDRMENYFLTSLGFCVL